MRFLVDAQPTPALARWLAANGHEAEHVSDVDMMSASDREIWEIAHRREAVIITKDEDFAILRNAVSGAFPMVVWLRVGNTRKGELLGWFEPLLPQIMEKLSSGETLVEIR